jgi:hypothetical protein
LTKKGEYLWIRSVSFVSLRELIYALSLINNAFRAKDITDIALNLPFVITQKGEKPSPTSMYHFRNTLLHLGVFTRNRQEYSINFDDPLVIDLISCLKPGSSKLTRKERIAWGELILRADDCRKHFFDLFMPIMEYDLQAFIEQGGVIAWQPVETPKERTIRLYNIYNPTQTTLLQSQDEIQGILYGIRYWARNELKIIDEFFLEDLGGVMYPIEITTENKESQIIAYFREEISNEEYQWHTFSIRDILFKLGPKLRLPVNVIHRTIIKLQNNYSEFIVFIPTSKSFATLTASSPVAEKYQLRGYFQDGKGRFISHIRIHKKFLEVYHENYK